MKIYFAGSIRGGRDDAGLYQQIISLLQKYGQVLTEHIGLKDLTHKGEDTLPSRTIFERDLGWVEEADVIVAEVTQPSLGVGYEIGRAEAWGKKILCLYRPSADRRLSAMVGGNAKVVVREYSTLAELEPLLADFFLFD